MNLTALLNFESALIKDVQTQSHELNIFAATSLKAFIEETFKTMTPSFIIVLSCRSKSVLIFFQTILQLVFHLVYHMNVQLIYIDRENPQRMEGLRKHNLLLVDSLEAFLDIDVISYTRNYNTNEFYHIFLMQGDRYVFNDMKSIFHYCWTNHIVNCNIQYQNSLGEIYMYTYFPFTPNECGSNEPQLINKFIGESWVNREFFHLKLKNFYGCPVTAAVRDIPPYSYMSRDEDGNVSFKGFEIDMMKLLEKKMNFTLKIRTTNIDDRSPPLYRGPLKMVRERTADLAFGYYRRRPTVATPFSYTFPHYQNKVVAIIYLPSHKLNTFEVLLYPFSNDIWYALSLTLLIIFVVIRVMRKIQPRSISVFSMVACALGVSIKKESKSPESVLIFVAWLWSSLLLRALYSGLLFHLLRYQVFSFIPDTLDRAVNKHFRAVMNAFTYKDIKTISIYENSLNRSSIVFPNEDEFIGLSFIERSANKKLYAVTSLDFLNEFIEKDKKIGLFYVIPEHIMQQQLCIYLAKHSYLIDQLDWEIIRIRSVGLINFWKRRYIKSEYYTISRLYVDTRFYQADLWSIYVVCGVFYIIALIMFIIEMLSLKINYLKRLFE